MTTPALFAMRSLAFRASGRGHLWYVKAFRPGGAVTLTRDPDDADPVVDDALPALLARLVATFDPETIEVKRWGPSFDDLGGGE
jgi:hypothetical protein